MGKNGRLDSLWRDYLDSRNEEDRYEFRNQLVEEYLRLVEYQSKKMDLPEHIDRKVLFQAGVVGLIGAVEKYNLSFNVKFETYAMPRIKGEILDELRDMDFASRIMRIRLKNIKKYMIQHETDYGKKPTREELARALNLNLGQIRNTLRFAGIKHFSLEEILTENNNRKGVAIPQSIEMNPEHEVIEQENKEIIMECIGSLPEKERKVMILHYYEGVDFKEIGSVLGVSESRVFQIHSKTLAFLRRELKRLRISL